MDIVNYLISENDTVMTAMDRIDTTGKKTVFAVDENKSLKAVLTDGDIRRFLLSGGKTDEKIRNVANYKPLFLYDSERDKAYSKLRENHIEAIPILNDDNIIISIEFMYENVDIDNISFRELTAGDKIAINAFFDQMAGDTRSMFNRGDCNRIRVNDFLDGKSENEKHFIAVSNKSGGEEYIVGYVFIWDTDTGIPWMGIAIHEDWKGRHMGRKLLKFIFGYSIENGYGGLMLTTVPANIRAQGLYERMGFEYQGIHSSGEYFYIKRFKK